ncbi:hypothetical protein BJV82DRAFT_584383 [Fennellomyces sp. T-0311]|nr:hypothetical protein BJV82DRAFT_584383 [Fennellomyces sp. T-0311]
MTLCMCLVVATAKEALARTALDVGTTAPNQQSEQARTREPLQSSSSIDTTNEPSSAAVPASNCLVLTLYIKCATMVNDEGYQVQAAGAVSTNANDPSMHSPTPTSLENTPNCDASEDRSWTDSDEDNDTIPLPQILSNAITNARACNCTKSKMSNADNLVANINWKEKLRFIIS